jgi:OPA family hexose phosphate transport protein UhpT-like MFS transporter
MFNFFLETSRSTLAIDVNVRKKMWLKPFILSYLAVFLAYMFMYIVRKNFTVAQNILIQDYGFTKTMLGDIAFGFSVIYALGKILLGIFSYNKNSKNLMMLFLLIAALGNIAMGFTLISPTFIFSAFISFYFINAFVQGGGSPNAFSTIVNWAPYKNRNLIISLWGLSHRIGGALAAVLALFGANYFFNGSVAGMFIFPGIIAFLFAIIGFFFGSHSPENYGLGKTEELFNVPVAYQDKDLEKNIHFSKLQIFKRYILLNPPMLLLILSYILSYTIIGGVMQWLIIYTKEVKNFTNNQSAELFSYLLAGGICVPFFAFLSDRIKGRNPVVISISIVLSICLLYLYTKIGSFSLLAIIVFILGATITTPLGIGALFVFKHLPKKAMSMADGFLGLCSYLIGDLIAKSILGRIADGSKILGLQGWSGAFTLIYIAMVLLLVLYICISFWEEKLNSRIKQ